MKEITVVTNDELETAIKMKYDIIFVVGDLVEKIKKTETLKNLSIYALTGVITAIILSCGAAPVTGGLSLIAASAVVTAASAATGVTLSTSVVIAIVSIGARLILNIYKDYDIREETINGENVRLKLTRKQ